MLNEADKKRVLDEMHLQIEEVKQKILELKELTKPIAPENAIGRVSRMDAINNKSVNEAALRVQEQKLYKMQEALKNKDELHFGSCVRCGNPIPVGRLLLIPESNRCVQCAS